MTNYRLTKQKKQRIISEMRGGMYRMNAPGCNHYGFNLISGGQWEGMYLSEYEVDSKKYNYQNYLNMETGVFTKGGENVKEC